MAAQGDTHHQVMMSLVINIFAYLGGARPGSGREKSDY
jgi:hypothetical protein